MDAKLKRRLDLLNDLLDVAVRIGCQFFACSGPLAPIRHQETCYRCAALHRAIRMGLINKADLGGKHTPARPRYD